MKRDRHVSIEGWFEREEAAIYFCDTHNPMHVDGYQRSLIRYRPATSGHGFIAFYRVSESRNARKYDL